MSPGNLPAQGSASDWPEPDLSLLDDRHGVLPDFPLGVLPTPWRTWVETAARNATASTDHVAASLMTVAASLIGTARRVAPATAWSEPCLLWTALVGPPSSGKTPAMETALRLTRELEGGLLAAHADSLRRHARNVTGLRARWQGEAFQVMRRGYVAPPQPDDPAPPSGPRRLTTADPAVEAISDALRHAPGGILLPRDHQGPWLDEMVRDSRGAGGGSLWLSAWSGMPCSVARKGKPAVSVARAAVSILGTIRPDAIAPALAGGDDGVAARFLFIWPQRAAFQPLAAARQQDRFDALAVLARLRDISPTPRDLPLASDGLACFDRFRQAHHAEADGIDGRAADWWGKGAGMVLRLAGVLAFLDWATKVDDTPEPAHVPAWAVRAAVDLWQDYLWPHAHAVLRVGGSKHRHRARRVLEWLAPRRCGEVSREQIRRDALAQDVDAAGADGVIDTLVEGDWLRLVEQRLGRRGPTRRRWLVNPAVSDAGIA